MPQSAVVFLTREVASKQLAYAGFSEYTHITQTHTLTYTTHTHTKTKKRNNNQHSICPQELPIQTRWATIGVNNSNLLYYSGPITEHCFQIAIWNSKSAMQQKRLSLGTNTHTNIPPNKSEQTHRPHHPFSMLWNQQFPFLLLRWKTAFIYFSSAQNPG